MDSDRPVHTFDACVRMFERFFLEAVELLGCALWDVFSRNHTVVDMDGTAYDLGSFRPSAGFIAESINLRYPGLGGHFGYFDFYIRGYCLDQPYRHHQAEGSPLGRIDRTNSKFMPGYAR